jgi:hypothetical protein
VLILKKLPFSRELEMMGTCLPGEQEHRARTQSSENKKSSKEDGAEETVDAITQGLEYALGILVSRRTRQKDMSAHNPEVQRRVQWCKSSSNDKRRASCTLRKRGREESAREWRRKRRWRKRSMGRICSLLGSGWVRYSFCGGRHARSCPMHSM